MYFAGALAARRTLRFLGATSTGALTHFFLAFSELTQSLYIHVKMALQNPNLPPRLFIPSANFNATPTGPQSQPPLRSAVQNNFHLPSLHVQQPSMQASFSGQFIPPPPHTPSFRGKHRQNASVAQFALNSPAPFQQSNFQPSLSPFPQSPGPSSFMKSRRTASISLGGPPKALLGGPQRRPSPLIGQEVKEQGISADSQQHFAQAYRKKKIVVNLPEESAPTIFEGKAYQSPPWARRPEPLQPNLAHIRNSGFLGITSRVIYTGEESNLDNFSSFEISLPSQVKFLQYEFHYLTSAAGDLVAVAKECP